MSPTETDRRISSKLGDFSIMKHLIDRETSSGSATSRFIGVNTSQNVVRPSASLSSTSSSTSSQQQQQQQQPYQNPTSTNRSISSSVPPPPSSSSTTGHPYNQKEHQQPQSQPQPQQQQQHQIASSQPRNSTFLKPDNKFNGRGGYNTSGQPPPVNKHDVSRTVFRESLRSS